VSYIFVLLDSLLSAESIWSSRRHILALIW